MSREDVKRWGRALFTAFVIFALLSLYLYLRRGYYNLYIINKVFGSSAVILAGITLIIGPLSKQISSTASWVTIRRHLGLTALGLAFFHLVVSLLLTDRFSWFSWYIREWVPVVFGFVGLFIWGYMAYISRNKKIQQLGTAVWKYRLSVAGKLAFLGIFLHVTIMKYPGWIRWWNGQVQQTPELANPEYPPASLFVFLVMVLVIFYRLFLFFYLMKKREDQQLVS